MSPILRRHFSARSALALTILIGLMSLPDAAGRWTQLVQPTAQAAGNFIVNSTGEELDSNPGDGICLTVTGFCTLMAAIQESNANATDDTIGFDPSLNGGTITLSTTLFPIAGNLTITGPGSGLLTVQRSTAGGTNEFRIFTINAGQTVSISGLRITNGNVSTGFSAPFNQGGGIRNDGTLVLTDCLVNLNAAVSGGGIFSHGTTTVNNSTISQNTSAGAGGGMATDGGTTTINNSTIKQNNSTGSGGGIANSTGETQSSVLKVNNSTISNNVSQGGNGGGGIFNIGHVFITNSTISTNTAVTGGGISNFNPMRLTNVTIAGNSATNSGGGVYNPGIGTISFGNTIIAGNTAPSGPDGNGFNFSSQDYNLIGNTSQLNFIGTTTHNITNVNALLSSLGNFGGPTQVHALLPGSPAIDAANNCVLSNTCSPVLEAAITTDQRGAGFPRAIDANSDGIATVDIGAYEARTIVVTNTQDSGAGSLRQAITDANSTTDSPIIVFQSGLTGTISLLTALPDIAASMGIAGPGANVLTVARGTADDIFRIFRINSGMTVSISGLTISNGDAFNATIFPNDSGGGILNFGTLTLTNCIVSGNRAHSGGGITNLGTLALNNSTVSGNSALGGSGGGGGIHSRAFSGGSLTASLTLNSSTISGNTSVLHGAGIYNSAGVGSTATLTILHSTISGNINSGSDGGGIYSIADDGGATNLRIDNSTISGNTAVRGGGLYHVSNGTGSVATANLTNSTITANNSGSSPTGAGGITLASGPGSTTTLILRNTIVAGNFRNSGTIASDILGAVDPTGSFNLIGEGTGMTGLTHGTNGNQVGAAGNPINPRLAALANNGGPTQTHALLAGSPALDAGDNTLATNAGLTTDQRGAGFTRIVDAADAGTVATVDIGAFEAQVSLPDLAGQAINEDSSLSLPFNVGGTITTVTATSSNTALVPNSPINITVTGSGATRTLVVNPVANAFGSSTITVTVNGANSQSMSDTFVLTVNPINDAPSFTRGSNQTVNENAGAQTVANWATNISAGPNETGQVLTFVITDNSLPGLFSTAPAISSTGTLTYTPATGVSGTAVISVVLKDDAGTANGGVDTSGTQSFSITVLDGGSLAFSSATYSVGESAGNATITINRSGGSAGTATVLFTTSNGTATAEDYTSVSQTITFNNGETSKTVNVAITDNLSDEPDETVNLTLSNAGGSGQLGTQTTAVLTIVDDDPSGGYLRFSSANYNTTESAGATTITVQRVGDSTAAVSVNYFTAQDSLTIQPCNFINGIATPRCDYTTAVGTLSFAVGETSKTFQVLISQDNYVEGPETLTLGLANPTGGATLATPNVATLTIADDAVEPATNPIDDAENFVRQHYHDFLNREPDAAGLAFWSNQITECQQPGATCNADVRRINVSAAFFLSIEFQETGYLVERLYKSAYGDAQGTSNFGPTHQLAVPIIRFHEFLPDTQEIGKDVVVGVGDWEAKIEANKVAFIQDFVLRSRFTTAFPTTLTPAQLVDALYANAGVTPSAAERTSVIGEFGGAGDRTNTAARARALRRVAENATLADQEKNKAFVLMQYFGYLRRDPNSSPDTDYSGYDFWLSKLNQFNGNFVEAEMVKAFITSGEYRERFGL